MWFYQLFKFSGSFLGLPRLIRWVCWIFNPTLVFFFFIQLHLSPRPRSLSPFEIPGRVDDTPEDGHSLELGSAKTWVGNQKPGWTSPKHVSNRWIPLRGEKTNHWICFIIFWQSYQTIGCWQKNSAFFKIFFLAKSKGFTSPIIFHRLPVEKELWKIISIPKKTCKIAIGICSSLWPKPQWFGDGSNAISNRSAKEVLGSTDASSDNPWVT